MWEAVVLVVAVGAITTTGMCLTLYWCSRSTESTARVLAEVTMAVARDLLAPAPVETPMVPTPESTLYDTTLDADPQAEVPAWAADLSEEEYTSLMQTGIDPKSNRAMW